MPNPTDFVVEVRDRTFDRLGQISTEFLDLQMVEAFRGVGAWQLKLPAEHPRLGDLKEKGSGIIVTERIRREVPQPPEYSAWVEERRNQLNTPEPTAYAGSTWGAPANFQSIPVAGWLGGTLTVSTTPYIFSATSARAYAAGEKVTLSIRYQVTGANTGAAQHIGVIPHVRTGNAYYRGTHVTRPIVVGQDEDVVVQWTTPVAIAAGNLDIAIVGSNAAGTGLATANAGFGMRATRAMIEDGWTDGQLVTGDMADTELIEFSWAGAPNASQSIKSTRTRTDLPPLVVYDQKIFSGRMQSAVLSQDAADPKGTWLITGVDDNVLGSAVNVLPDPFHEADAQESDYWNYAGTGEVVMKAAVALNAGSGAIASRQYPWLSVAPSLGRGLAVSATARFDKLGDLLGSLGAKSGLGWRFAQDGDGITFDVFEPEDKSAYIRLDIRNGGLQSNELGYSAPSATDAFVLGQGQGAERTVRKVTSPEAIAEAALWGLRWEVAKDQRNTDDPTELQQAGEEILTAQGATVHSLKVVPSDAPNQRIRIDWDLGDIVTVILDDAPATATVTEVATSVTKAGVIRTATVGDPVGYDWEAKLTNRVREHETRLGDLERLVDSGVTWDGVAGKPLIFPTRAPISPAGQEVTDWDTAITPGFYWGKSAANQPTVAGGTGWWTGTVELLTPDNRITQTVHEAASARFTREYTRHFNGTTWSAWQLRAGRSDWINPGTLSNSFTQHATAPVQYTVNPSRVEFSGGVYRATAAPTTFTTVFTLAAGTPLPANQVRFAGRDDVAMWIAITSLGEVQIKANATLTGGVGYMFDGVGYAY